MARNIDLQKMLDREFDKKARGEEKKKMQQKQRQKRIADKRLKDQIEKVRMSSTKKLKEERSEPEFVPSNSNQVMYDLRGYNSNRVFEGVVPLRKGKNKRAFHIREKAELTRAESKRPYRYSANKAVLRESQTVDNLNVNIYPPVQDQCFSNMKT